MDDKDKSIFENITDTVRAAAESIAHPTAGTPIEMPLNESGYAITHLKSASKGRTNASANKTDKKSAKKAPAKKLKFARGKKNIGKNKKKVVRKAAKKKKKSRR